LFFMRTCNTLTQLAPFGGAAHLAIGMFDGLHLGHQAVISGAVRAARASGGAAVVVTFAPHPSRIFQPANPDLLILDEAEKARRIAALGVDVLVRQAFSAEFAQTEAAEFERLLRGVFPGLRSIHAGDNFRFGRGRGGGAAELGAGEAGLRVEVTPGLAVDGGRVSSTRIRGLLAAGEMAAANRLLGYNYTSRGVVVSGRALGRTIGFPTLNLRHSPELRPRFGVYAVRARREENADGGGVWFSGVANYGLRPTVETGGGVVEPLLETHLFADAAGVAGARLDAGEPLCVEWLEFLRAERKFADFAALTEQIRADVAEAMGRRL
jgi:riboflavin kinase/FMN adenylyltransferase